MIYLKSILKTYSLFNKAQKLRFMYVVTLMLVAAILDVVGIISIMPFISMINDPLYLTNNYLFNPAYEFFLENYNYSKSDFIFLFGVFLVIFLFTSAFFRAYVLKTQLSFSANLEYFLTKSLYKKLTNMPYISHKKRGASELVKAVLADVAIVITSNTNPLLVITSQALVVTILLSSLLVINPIVSISVAVFFSLAYYIMFLLLKRRLEIIARNRFLANEERYKSATQTFNGIKTVKSYSLETFMLGFFNKSAKEYALLQGKSQFLAQLPKLVVEALTFGSIVLVILYNTGNEKSLSSFLPELTLFALAGYRLLPSMQAISKSITNLKISKPSLDLITKELTKNYDKSKNNLKFKKSYNKEFSVIIKDLTFSYSKNETNVIENLALNIKRGDSVGFVGATGSGKTTLIDTIAGLLEPTNGSITLNSNIQNANNANSNIAYVPQDSFLLAASIRNNIILDMDYDYERMISCAKAVELHYFVTTELPNGYNTNVGEGGSRLSGGQKQRVALARALYKNPSLLILDESTSALDNVTEDKVIMNINGFSNNISKIMIAHRITTLKNCDVIYVMEKGVIVDSGNYNDLSSRNKFFSLHSKED